MPVDTDLQHRDEEPSPCLVEDLRAMYALCEHVRPKSHLAEGLWLNQGTQQLHGTILQAQDRD
jgi:hypothetical protein